MNQNASRVLIVDDMSINRMILSSLLAAHGVLSDQTDNGHDCLEMCSKREYDLILLDHRMPGFDGVDTFVALKEVFAKRGRPTPVVCHTTEEGRKNINLYKAAGFADVLIKPINPQQLLEVILTYLPEREQEAALIGPELAQRGAKRGDDEMKDELDKLPLWLKTVPHIDLVTGIENCEFAEDYVDALYVFHSSIEERSKEIEYDLQNEDWTMYMIAVHSLKSMARLIGAKFLGETAAALETAAEEGEYEKIRRETPALLRSYRQFSKLLAPLMSDEDILRILSEPKEETAPPPEEPVKIGKTILFIQSNHGIVTKGIENHLKVEDYSVVTIPDEPDMIIAYRNEADIIIYYPCEDDRSHIRVTMNLLGEICQDDAKILCVTGDMADLEVAMDSNGAQRVSRSYPRPLNIPPFLRDMERFTALLEDYHRRKTIFVVDDDPDYRSVIERWLSTSYHVSVFHGGQDLLSGLKAATPDLILLDYEMPGMDGYELMRCMRTDHDTKEIPIIFLTGKNDRDHVFRILEYKPDGYLLKSSQKEALLDAIHRFFAESMFRASLL